MVSVDIANNPKPILDAVKLLQNQGEKQEALLLVRKALKRYPKDIETAILAGLLHQDMNHPKLAEKYFRQALSIDPKNPDSLKSLGLFIFENHLTDPVPSDHQEGLDYLIKYLQVIKGTDYTDYEVLKIVSGNTIEP